MSEAVEGQRVCVLGLGNMGSALAERFLAQGREVTVWNRTDAKCTALVKLGAEMADTAADGVRNSDTIVVCVLDIEASKAILSSEGMEPALAGKTVIQLTSIEPNDSRALGEWLQERQANYLDGAILGYPSDVRRGTVRIVYSGPKRLFENQRDILTSLGEEAIHVGEQAGLAPVTGNIVYARYYGVTFAYLHTAAMAKAAGIPINMFRELTNSDEDWTWMGRTMGRLLDKIETGNYSTTEATLDVDYADYNILVRMCRELGIEPALHELIEDVLSRSIKEGRGDQEIAAIFEVLSASSKR